MDGEIDFNTTTLNARSGTPQTLHHPPTTTDPGHSRRHGSSGLGTADFTGCGGEQTGPAFVGLTLLGATFMGTSAQKPPSIHDHSGLHPWNRSRT